VKVYNLNKDLLDVGWLAADLPMSVPPKVSGLSGAFFVKATFRLHPDKAPTPWEKGPKPISGDLMIDGDKKKGLGYASDIYPYKPQADFSAIGTAYPPKGATTHFLATIKVGDHARQIVVFGDRQWQHGITGEHPGVPDQVKPTQLSWDNARGGPDYPLNPQGRGRDGRLMTALEDPQHLLHASGDNIGPTLFAPFPKTAPIRASKRGTYDRDWVKARWPWVPPDFDFSQYNAPHPYQWIQGYLKGDEELEFENMHPKVPHYKTHLPGLRARCFVRQISNWKVGLKPEEDERVFREVPLVLDTLWADMDKEQLILVWRGRIPIRSFKFRDIDEVLLLTEPLAETQHPLSHYEELLKVESTPPPPAVSAEPVPKVPSQSPLPAKKALPKAAAKTERPKLSKATKAPETPGNASDGRPSLPQGILPPNIQEMVHKILANVDSMPPPVTPAMDEVLGKIASHPNISSEASEKLRLVAADMAKKAAAANLHKPKVPKPEKLHEPEPSVADSHAELPKKLVGISKDLKDKLSGWVPRERYMTNGQLDPEKVRKQTLFKANLAGCDFSGLDLSGLDCRAAMLKGSKFIGTKLVGADLLGADLTECDLTGADLCEATLHLADLAKCLTEGTLWAGTSLTGAKLGKLNLAGADFSGCKGDQADFSGADLRGANFRESVLISAGFSDCRLAKSDFTKAFLHYADFHRAKGPGIIMEDAMIPNNRAGKGTDFTRGRFRRVKAPKSLWEHAVLEEADFRDAEMPGARFCEALMRDTNFDRAILSKCSFEDAVLHRSRLTNANLLRCALDRADLTWASLEGSNLYGSGMWETIFHGANWHNAIITKTRLSRNLSL
jgi:uncharacterized protein YjbI with pentapeptide repeats